MWPSTSPGERPGTQPLPPTTTLILDFRPQNREPSRCFCVSAALAD